MTTERPCLWTWERMQARTRLLWWRGMAFVPCNLFCMN